MTSAPDAGAADRPEGGLAGKRVAFTGRLASLPRAAAAALVERRGGSVGRSVSRCTDLLVVGRDGPPLRSDGRPTRKLRRAETFAGLGYGIEILAEEEFLRRAGPTDAAVLGLHPLPEAISLLGVTRRQVESWVRAGLVAPAGESDGVPVFDYAGLAAARSLATLLAAGVPVRAVSRSLRRLAARLPGADAPLAALSRLSLAGGRLVVRTAGGRLAEPGGQLLLGFAGDGDAAEVLPLAEAVDDELFGRAVERERAGELEAAADLYRRLLLEEGPDAEVAFNLGNVLFALGRGQAAAERFRLAAELDPGFADAWHNLGAVLADADDTAGAAEAYARAAADPDYADARYGLAGALESLGRFDEARPHWRAYLELEPLGECADYARRRLAETGERPTG